MKTPDGDQRSTTTDENDSRAITRSKRLRLILDSGTMPAMR